jgi:hypothetical protein
MLTLSRKTRLILGSVLAVVALGGALALTLRSRQGAQQAADQSTSPVVSLERPVVKHTEGGQLAWQIRLKQVDITHGSGLLAAEGIQEALIYGQNGAPLVRVTAEKVTGTAGGSDFQVTGKVTVVSYQGLVLNTDTVKWSQSAGKIVCPAQITARTREALFSTTGLTYDLNTSAVSAPGTVSLYSGQNKILGKSLTYNVKNGDFSVNNAQMVFEPQEAQRLLREVHP